MSEWPISKLGDLTTIVMGQSPPGETYNTAGRGLPFFQGKAEFGDEHPEIRKWCDTPLRIAEAGDILLSVRAPVGPTNVARERCCIGRGLAAIRPRGQNLSPRFLLYFFTAFESTIAHQGAGSTFDAISRAVIQNLDLPLPPLSEQERIASILDETESLRRIASQADERIRALSSSLFEWTFSDHRHSPKGTRLVRLEEVTTKVTDGVHLRPDYTDSGVPFISVKNITTGRLQFNDCKYISPADHRRFTKRWKAEPLDTLYTKVGATYGRAALVDTDQAFSIYVSVCLIKPDKTQVEPRFLNAVLNTAAVKRQADQRIKGIGVPDLHLDQIREFLIPIPPITLQREFAARLDDIHQLEAKQRTRRKRVDDLFKSLLRRAFQGEL